MYSQPVNFEPCPFCGGKAALCDSKPFANNFWAGFEFGIQCTKCKVKYPKTFRVIFTISDEGIIKEVAGTEGSIKSAENEWNRRADNG